MRIVKTIGTKDPAYWEKTRLKQQAMDWVPYFWNGTQQCRNHLYVFGRVEVRDRLWQYLERYIKMFHPGDMGPIRTGALKSWKEGLRKEGIKCEGETSSEIYQSIPAHAKQGQKDRMVLYYRAQIIEWWWTNVIE